VASFSDQIGMFFTEFFALNPLAATAAGMHDHDSQWPDLTEAGRAGRLGFAERWARVFEATPVGQLDRDEAVDRQLLLLVLDEIRFEDEELRQLAWDSLEWVYVMGAGIFPLIAREFAPLADRLGPIAGRGPAAQATSAKTAAALASACRRRRYTLMSSKWDTSGRFCKGTQVPSREGRSTLSSAPRFREPYRL